MLIDIVQKTQQNKQPILFIANGIIISGLHLGIYYICAKFWMDDLLIANMIAFLCAFSVNFISQSFIFNKRMSYFSFSKYFLSQLVVQSVNGVLLKFFSQIHLIWLFMCIQAYVTYWINKKIIFNP